MGFSGLDALEGVDDSEELSTMLVENMQEYVRKQVHQGWLDGEAKGQLKGQSALLLRQAKAKFGSLDAATVRRIEGADEQTMLRLADRLLTAPTLKALFEEDGNSGIGDRPTGQG